MTNLHATKTAIISSLSAILLTACSNSSSSNQMSQAIPKDNTQPVLVIDNLQTISNQDNYHLSGSVVDAGGLLDTQVTVVSKQTGQSQTITLDNLGKFSVTIPLQEGENSLNITVMDKAGNRESKTLLVVKDSVAPVLTLDNVLENAVSRTSVLSVSGKISDNQALNDVVLTLGSTPVKPNADGTFVANVDLTAGENTIELVATDKAGNQSKQSAKIYQGFIMSAGTAHTGILHNGKLYVWGQNNLGQVGMGKVSKADDLDHPHTPFLLANAPKDIVSISFNNTHSSLLTKDGAVYTWGANNFAQLGHGISDKCGSTDCVLNPTQVKGLPKIIMLSSGQRHHLTLAEDGNVYAFGYNSDGQLGSDIKDKGNSTPVKVDFSKAKNIGKIIQVSAGSNSSYALDDKGQVWAWGKNQFGNLGQGTTCEAKNNCEDFNPTPVLVKGLENIKIKEISAGGDHVLALTTEGMVYGWGENRTSQIGFNSDKTKGTDKAWANNLPMPTLIPWSEKHPAKHIYAKLTASALIDTNGNFYQWGVYGDNVQNNGKNTIKYYNLDEPSNETPLVKNLYDVGMGNTHRIIKDQAGNILTLGWNFNGSLGVSELQSSWMYNIPQPVTLP